MDLFLIWFSYKIISIIYKINYYEKLDKDQGFFAGMHLLIVVVFDRMLVGCISGYYSILG